MCSVPKAHYVTAQGNALGKCKTNVPSPNGANGVDLRRAGDVNPLICHE